MNQLPPTHCIKKVYEQVFQSQEHLYSGGAGLCSGSLRNALSSPVLFMSFLILLPWHHDLLALPYAT